MPAELPVLLLTTASIAVIHTASGPDHYVPFVVLSRARGWSRQRTLLWVLLCGCGHVWTSVLLALLAAAVGWSVVSVTGIQGFRGSLSGWALFGFGIAYMLWSFWQLHRNRLHRHFELSGDELYVFQHRDEGATSSKRHRVTPWILFLVFLLGPCEPMVPLLFLPAARAAWWSLALLVGIYTAMTLLVMAVLVLLLRSGISVARWPWLERYMQVFCGATMTACGAALLFLGW